MPSYRVYAASRAGGKHGGLDANNQDAHAVHADADGAGVVLVVCDGAGSRRHSRAGAELGVRQTLSFLRELDWAAPFRPQAEDFLAGLQAALAAAAAARDVAVRELACTLVAAAATPTGWRAMQVGDGFLVAQDLPGGPYRLVFPIVKGEYANETVFVTQDAAAAHLMVYEGGDGEAPYFICLSTDGVERQAIRLREGEPHPPFFDYLAKLADSDGASAHLVRFLSLPALDAATDDDRTLVCARLE